jgi:NitT/TauT family transport system substrate-binding protein
MARLIAPRVLALALAAAVIVPPGPAAATHANAAQRQTETVTISMGYTPNVQFAPFYLAVKRGYYAAAGVNVKFDYATSTDVIRLVGAGNIAFGNAEADQVIVGKSRGLPVVSVFTQYQRFPVVIFALAGSGIHSFRDLKGKTIGIPGLYGASFTGLLAALKAAHLTSKDVKISSIGYAQVAAIAQHRVDAAVGFAMNEPVQLRQLGMKVTVLPIDSLVALGGPGVVTSEAEIAKHADLVSRFIAATLRGQRDTNADPQAALTASRSFMPAFPSSQLPYQLAVLKEAVKYWTPSAGHGLGCAYAPTWNATEAVLLQQHQIPSPVNTSVLFTNRFVSGC